ncbi:hypothetical protein D3C72_1092640 [compost metagenome]
MALAEAIEPDVMPVGLGVRLLVDDHGDLTGEHTGNRRGGVDVHGLVVQCTNFWWSSFG